MRHTTILQKASVEYRPQWRQPMPYPSTAAAGVPLSTPAAELATLAFDAGVGLSIRRGLGSLGPDSHLIQIMGHTHGPFEMLPGFGHQGARVEMEG
jgi:hypothetical protein